MNDTSENDVFALKKEGRYGEDIIVYHHLLLFMTLLLCFFYFEIPLDRGRPPPQPFIDISCGGHLMSNSSDKRLYLWAVSQQGRVSDYSTHHASLYL